jgi:hypothetical protein
VGFDELWLGHQPNSHNDNEVYVRYPGLTGILGTVDVASASLELLPYFQRANDGVTVVRRVNAPWSADSMTWLTRPTANDTDAVSVTSEPGAWSSLDVSTYVTDILSRGQADNGLVLSGDDTTNGTWKRLAASDSGDAAQFGPRLVVTWSGMRPTAFASTPTSGASTTAPTLSWANPQLAGAQVRFQIQISRDGFATIDASSGTVRGAAGKLRQWTVPSGALSSAGLYTWRVRARFGTDKTWSDWSVARTLQYGLGTDDSAPPHSAVSAPSAP